MGWTLCSRRVKVRNGREVTIYFFAKPEVQPLPRANLENEFPPGYGLQVRKEVGIPFLVPSQPTSDPYLVAYLKRWTEEPLTREEKEELLAAEEEVENPPYADPRILSERADRLEVLGRVDEARLIQQTLTGVYRSRRDLLSPATAVWLTWALTGHFSSEFLSASQPPIFPSRDNAKLAEDVLEQIQKQTEDAGPPWNQYVAAAVVAIRGALRSLHTVYTGRKLNFDENEKLRQAYLDSAKEMVEFGKSATDFLKALPTTGIPTAAGYLYVSQVLRLSDLATLLLTLSFAGLSYGAYVVLLRWRARATLNSYIRQDYERDLYYRQYLQRVKIILISLYENLVALCQAARITVPVTVAVPSREIVEQTLPPIQPMCKYVHKHMSEGRIRWDLWAKCETGGIASRKCELWEGDEPLRSHPRWYVRVMRWARGERGFYHPE